ncbi:PfkB family carbohydrate kinase [Deinococcus sp. Leaf326]|uniref:PfkB family carbohydrate kinase n=1 Tax=Deinococcus sp. Leaf326 TaxID=1736338 RepID=UPI0006F57A25|nr:PfkB family carbohydrate kinase [Deinococcus sp. Leaf326]KQR35636.1 ribokinase [Deinococcus sp. Leaf326]
MPETARPQVTFVGSVHLDRMLRLAALPAPGETVIAQEGWSQLGGKAANQALAAAGTSQVGSILVACLGQDNDGRQAQQYLETQGVTAALEWSALLPTGSSVALLDAAGENVGVVSPGANADLSAGAVLEALRTAPDLLVCQWETSAGVLREVLTAARTAGVPTLLNAAPWLDSHRDLVPLADHVVVNAVEAQAWTGTDPQTRPTHLDSGHSSVVVTLGAGGVLLYEQGELTLDLPAPRVEARSTHGAGDHFVGVLAARLACGEGLTQALEHAVASAAQFVQQLHKHLLSSPA